MIDIAARRGALVVRPLPLDHQRASRAQLDQLTPLLASTADELAWGPEDRARVEDGRNFAHDCLDNEELEQAWEQEHPESDGGAR